MARSTGLSSDDARKPPSPETSVPAMLGRRLAMAEDDVDRRFGQDATTIA